MGWVIRFTAVCSALVIAVLAALWFSGVFGDLGLSLHGTIALFIGVTLTTVVGVGLMALLFYSDRSRHDDLVSRDESPRHER